MPHSKFKKLSSKKVQMKTDNKRSNAFVEARIVETVHSFWNLHYLIDWLFSPTCSRSLGFVRACFGLMMVLDVPEERGLTQIESKFGNPLQCHFPLFDWLSPLKLEYMGVVYLLLWAGAIGICLGLMFKFSCFVFSLTYWYLLLLDKTAWNNHSYLFGLLAILFLFSSAHHSFSVDALLNPSLRDVPVPRWNYAIIRFQIFLLYFYAGLKKLDRDWIEGHSMTNLSSHWVFDPFKLVLNEEQIDLWIIHYFGLVFDLSVGFFLLADKTRPFAIIFSTAFHIMNSRIFHIGQFPYVCLAMTPIFCPYDWPDQLLSDHPRTVKEVSHPTEPESTKKTRTAVGSTLKQRLTTLLLVSYVGMQLFLPYSHQITKGYNNWTNGLYGYSWDMMVHSWDTVLVVVKVIDKDTSEEIFLDPEAWVGNDRYSKHGDMLVQYAQCLKKNLNHPPRVLPDQEPPPRLKNVAIYIDVWCSLNGRFQQRMFDPRQDLLKVTWTPFTQVSWLMPLLSDLNPWRRKMTDIEAEVHSWSNYSDTLFVADFPGLYQENYITPDLVNVSLTVLQGSVVLEQITDKAGTLVNVSLTSGEWRKVHRARFHKVYTLGLYPSCYVYTFVNRTMELMDQDASKNLGTTNQRESSLKGHSSLVDSATQRWENFKESLHILDTYLRHLYHTMSTPLQKGGSM